MSVGEAVSAMVRAKKAAVIVESDGEESDAGTEDVAPSKRKKKPQQRKSSALVLSDEESDAGADVVAIKKRKKQRKPELVENDDGTLRFIGSADESAVVAKQNSSPNSNISADGSIW